MPGVEKSYVDKLVAFKSLALSLYIINMKKTEARVIYSG